MELLAEIILDVLLLVGIYLVQWCARHKEATKAIIVVILMVVDVIVLYKYFK